MYCINTGASCSSGSYLHPSTFRFSQSGLYFAPKQGPYQSYTDYIRKLPLIPKPEVFGLHENADITKDNQETQTLFDCILLTLPRQTGGGGSSPGQVVGDLAADIEAKLPPDYDIEAVSLSELFPFHCILSSTYFNI